MREILVSKNIDIDVNTIYSKYRKILEFGEKTRREEVVEAIKNIVSDLEKKH